jgi:hypothetical protein
MDIPAKQKTEDDQIIIDLVDDDVRPSLDCRTFYERFMEDLC